MRFAVFNTIVALILCCGFSAVVSAARQEQSQPAPAPDSSQPQSEPAQPEQASPEQTTPAETPQPPPAQNTQPPPPQTPSTQEPAPSSAPKEASPAATKPKSTKKKRKPATKNEAGNQAGKVVIKDGGATEGAPQISPGMSDQQARHQRETTRQLLATTDATLKRVSATQLTPAQQSMLDQINSYIRQSKAASDSGDVSRAHTLAFKAHLLSDELARK
jgi:hypothetical protein